MRTHVEFRSDAFPPDLDEDEVVNPGRYGRRLAEHIVAGLPAHGFRVSRHHPEDWGWRIALENETFPLWVGCGNYEEYEDGFLCFIQPSKPFVRRWLKRVSTTDTIERLADALERILGDRDTVRDLRWWTDKESGRT